MKKKSLFTAILASVLVLESTTNVFASFIDTETYESVLNTENGPRYYSLYLPRLGDEEYFWEGRYQWVDLDHDGVFECRYFLCGDENDSERGYLYQPGMELSDSDKVWMKAYLWNYLSKDGQPYRTVKDGQMYACDGQPCTFYRYGKPIEGSSGRQYRLDNQYFNDVEGRLGNMVAKEAGSYIDESIFKAECQQGIEDYHKNEYEGLPRLIMYHETWPWGRTKEDMEEFIGQREDIFQGYSYEEEYTKYIDSKGIIWFVGYDAGVPTSIQVQGFDFGWEASGDHVNHCLVYMYTLSHAKELGIDIDYVISCINIE